MKINYRLTSGAALGTVALAIVSSFLPRATGTVGSVLCSTMDDQFDTMPKLVSLVMLGAYFVFIVQGLRNRSGPRWLAIAGVLALFLPIATDWRISAGCYSTAGVAVRFLVAGVVGLMFLHHAFQPRTKFLVGHRSGSFGGSHPAISLRLACRGVLPVLVFMPIAWSALKLLWIFGQPNLTQEAIVTAQRCISWATFALFLIAAALLLALLIIRLRSSLRT